jgi:hypothetical protein
MGAGRFEVLSWIGEGGVGVVYEVKDRQSDSRLALKTVRSTGPEALASLKREFRAVQDIAHPNLVRLDELFEEEGVWFFTMELVEGKDWLTYVRSSGDLDSNRVRATLVQIVDALATLHANGMVHRDVKPTNVLVARDGTVKLLDFGIVAARSHIADPGEGIVGTVGYMAPEQLLAEEPTPASDFYALGAMLYQALTGKVPYFDRPDESLAEAKVKGPPTPAAQVAPRATNELANLCDALLRVEPSQRPDADAIRRALGVGAAGSSGELAVAKEAFVGRAGELGQLRDAYSAAKKGSTVAVLVEGASGVGKSALVRTFLEGVRAEALVLHGRCHEREYVPYKGVDAIVDELAVYLTDAPDEVFSDLEGPAMGLLPRLFPVLQRVPFFARLAHRSLRLPVEGGASELRARLFGAFRDLVRHVTRVRTVVISIDDVQWADGDSLALLGDLLAPPSPPPVLLVCTRRLGEEADAKAHAASELAFSGDVRALRLSGLTDEELASLASRLSPDARLEGAELRQITRESGGHPLFLQELMRQRAHGTAGPRLRLDDALWDRVRRLEPAERSLVEASAVAGVPTSLDLVAAAAGIERNLLAKHMATLRGLNLVKVSASGRTRRIEPYHDRVREAVVRNIGEDAMRAWHGRLARAIDASAERDVERLALHWEGAGDASRAAALLREAGDRASQAFAFDRAVELYQRSLALGGGRGAKDLELALAEALFDAGRGEEAGRAFLALAGDEADRPALELRVRAANAYFGSGYYKEGIAAMQSVLDAVGIRFPQKRLQVIASILWNRFLVRRRGLALADRSIARASAEEVLRSDVCTNAAFGIGMADTVRGQTLHCFGVRLALDLGDARRAARSLCGFALATSTGGRKSAALTDAAIAKARQLASGLADPRIDALINAAAGFKEFMLEDFVAAERFLGVAAERFQEVRGVTYELATARMMHGRSLFQLGRFDRMAAYQGPPLRDAIRRNDVYTTNNTRSTVSAVLSLVRDDVAACEAELAETARVLVSYQFQLQHVYSLLAACAMDLYRGAPEGVLSRLDASQRDLRDSLFERVQSVRIALESLRARAHIALAARGRKGGGEHLAAAERSARHLSDQNLPGATAQSLLARAGIAAVSGDVPAAVQRLREAIAGFDERSMAIHAASARLGLVRLVGGDEGKKLERVALAAFAAQRVVAPVRFAGHYAPGLSLGV